MTKHSMDIHGNHVSRWQTPHLLGDEYKTGDNQQTEEEIRKLAYEDSYVKGYQAGIKAGQEKVKQQLELLSDFISQLSSPFHEMNQQISEALAELAGKIARALVKRELRTEPETIMAIVRDSILALGDTDSPVSIHLHPDDAEILRDINLRMTNKPLWSVIEDPLLSRGDCKVANGVSLVDENIQNRINLVITQFLGDDRSEHRNEPQ